MTISQFKFAPLLALLALCQTACVEAESGAAAAVNNVGASASSTVAVAVSAAAASDEVFTTIKARLANARPDLVVSKVEESQLPGVYAVEIVNGPTIYASASGDHFIAGDLYAVRDSGIVNLAEEQRQGARVKQLAALDNGDMIVFAPEGKAKASVTVFTDIDCGYCRKLHLEVPELNRMGVEVRYLGYPRAGVGSPSYDKLVTAWCSSDKKRTLTALKNNDRVETKKCANPVAQHFAVGQQVGVTGTPALVTESGELLPGYMPAEQLAAALGIKAK